MIGLLASHWWDGPEQEQARATLLICDSWDSQRPSQIESAVFNPLPPHRLDWRVAAWAYLLKPYRQKLRVVVVDGHADGPRALGRPLHEDTGVPVVGVRRSGPAADSYFSGLAVRRGRPLYVSTWKYPLWEAVEGVEAMKGHRVPSLLAQTRREALGPLG